MFNLIVTEQVRLGDLAGALATALGIPGTGNAYVNIEQLTIIAFSFPESDAVRHAIEEIPLTDGPMTTLTPMALTMAYAALRDWHRSLALAVTLEGWDRREGPLCILRMFGSPSDLSCLTLIDL